MPNAATMRIGSVFLASGALVACSLLAPSRDDYVGSADATPGSDAPAASSTNMNEAAADAPPDADNPCGRPSTPNVILNDSFENDLSGWIPFQSKLALRTVPNTTNGTWAALVTRQEGSEYAIDDHPDPLKSPIAGHTYLGSAFVAAAVPQAIGKPVVMHLRQRPSESEPETKNVASKRTILTEAFQPVCVRFVADVSGGQLGLYIVQEEAVGGDAFYVDSVALQEMP